MDLSWLQHCRSYPCQYIAVSWFNYLYLLSPSHLVIINMFVFVCSIFTSIECLWWCKSMRWALHMTSQGDTAAVLQCCTRCMQQARICHVILSESDLKPCLHRDNCQQMRLLLRKSNTTYPFNLRALSTKQVTSLGFTDCGWLSADCRELSDESNIFWHFKL